MPGIFISYRRRDSSGYVNGLEEALRKHFGSIPVFRDLDSIEYGVDFAQQIGEHVASCNVMLAVIGSNWLTEIKKDRLDNSGDYVRKEIQQALDRNIRVIPVLVGGASMPSAADLPAELGGLARRNAIELSDTRWDYDVGRLLNSLSEVPGLKPVAGGLPQRLTSLIVGLAIASTLMLFLVVLGMFSLDPLERTVLGIAFFSLPLLGVAVGAGIGNLATPLRGALGGALIGGLNTLIAWSGGWWLSAGGSSPGPAAMEVFRSIMLYLPGSVIASAVVGAAAAAIGGSLASRRGAQRRR